jgi:hypothetical protein
MRTLVYKRTHKGDPDVEGCFGVHPPPTACTASGRGTSRR